MCVCVCVLSSFISEFKNRLIDSYTVEWKEKLSTREYFTFYSSIKHSLTLSHYLLHVNHVQARSALARFRMGMSELRSRSLRYNSPLPNTPVNCPSCTDMIENEVHFLLVCPLYSDIRHQYIPEKFTRRPSLAKLSILLASANQNLCANVALFVYHAFKARSLFIATACNWKLSKVKSFLFPHYVISKLFLACINLLTYVYLIFM